MDRRRPGRDRFSITAAAVFLLLGPGNMASVSAAHAASNTVIDGNARFQVLTPTLIRLEYAGDGAFQDSATFTAVNRSFPAVPYTTDVSGGYREIVTSAVTLRYKENSGPFTPASVPSLTNDSQLAANHRVFGHEE